MRIAILGPYSLDSKVDGGVERHIKNLLYEFKEAEFETHIFSISKYEQNNIQKIRPNVILHTINSKKLPMTITGVTIDLYHLIKKVNKIEPDLIHGQMLGAPYGIATYFLSKKYPSVLTIHTLISQNSKIKRTLKSKLHDALWHYLEKVEIKNIKNIITVSEHLCSEISFMGGSRIYSISNGIKSEWLKIESKTIESRILFVGRIIPIKGIENLIKAVYYVKKCKKDINIHIVGPHLDTNYFEFLQRLVIKLKISDNVIFTGALYGEKLFKEYSESHVFVLPSHDESNPFVLIEAMGAGIPIVSTNAGGIPYLISEGENGFLVEDNDIEDLSGKIIYLLNDKETWSRISNNNREKAKLYLWSCVANKTMELYKKIINEKMS